MIQDLNRGIPGKPIKNSPKKSLSPRPSKNNLFSSPLKERPDEGYFLRNSPHRHKYVPSRYGVSEVMQSTNGLSKNALLNNLQQKIEMVDDEMSKMSPEKMNNRLKEIKSYQPPSKSPIVSEFKSKPIRKSENDFLAFKEIFVAPKEKILYELREKEKVFTDLIHQGAQKQYDKLIGVEKDEPKNINTTENKLKRTTINFSTPNLIDNESLTSTFYAKEPSLNTTRGFSDKTMNFRNVYKSHNKLQIPVTTEEDFNEPEQQETKETKRIIPSERIFFEQQIQVSLYFYPSIRLIKGSTSRNSKFLDCITPDAW